MQQLSLAFQCELPKALSAKTSLLEKIANLYSADILDKNRIRGIVSHSGLQWVCTGCVYHHGIEAVHLKELLPPDHWNKETYLDARSCRDATGCIYQGRLITHRNVKYVMGERKLELFRENTEPPTIWCNTTLKALANG